MAELFKSITDFVLSIIVFWWLLIPGVLLAIVALMTLCSEKVDELFTSNKSLVRRYAIPISIIGLFIACFLAFHEERMAHEKTKQEYKQNYGKKGFNELNIELEKLRNENVNIKSKLDKLPTEPQIETTNKTVEKDENGIFTVTITLRIISPYSPNSLFLFVQADPLEDADWVLRGVMIVGKYRISPSEIQLLVKNPYGSYQAVIKTTNPDSVKIHHKFE